MGNVIYIDILFATDLSCDIFSLYITGRLCHLEARPFRLFTSALFGSAASAALTLLQLDGRLSLLLGLPVSAIMCLISYGWNGFGSLLRRTALLWSAGSLLYGTVSAIIGFLSVYFPVKYYSILSIAFALSVPLIIIVSRAARPSLSKKSASVAAVINGRTVSLRCLVDSGNLLCEPISGYPVIVISGALAAKVFPNSEISYLLALTHTIPESIRNRLRIIPSKTVNGEKLLRAVRADSVKVDGVRVCAFVSFEDVPEGTFGDYSGIIPSALVQGKSLFHKRTEFVTEK